MKRLTLACSILAASVVGAAAADLPPRVYTKAPPKIAQQTFGWTGWYVGAQLGGTSGEANHSIVLDGLGFLNAPFGPTKIDGFNYGGIIGYDRQMSPTWVLGVNAEFNGGKIKGLFDNGPPQGFGPGGDDIYKSKVRWFGSVRGKIGWVVPGAPWLMVYATNGVAFAEIWGANGDGLDGTSALDVRQGSGSTTKVGYTVGGGVSWMIPGTRWVLTGEGAYYDFGRARIDTVTNDGTPHIFKIDTQFAVGRAVFSYKF